MLQIFFPQICLKLKSSQLFEKLRYLISRTANKKMSEEVLNVEAPNTELTPVKQVNINNVRYVCTRDPDCPHYQPEPEPERQSTPRVESHVSGQQEPEYAQENSEQESNYEGSQNVDQSSEESGEENQESEPEQRPASSSPRLGTPQADSLATPQIPSGITKITKISLLNHIKCRDDK